MQNPVQGGVPYDEYCGAEITTVARERQQNNFNSTSQQKLFMNCKIGKKNKKQRRTPTQIMTTKLGKREYLCQVFISTARYLF